jgi:lysophospholipase L1-like esterase
MILVSTALALGLAEIILRAIEPTSDTQVIEINDTESGDYTSLRPNTSGLILGRTVSINEQGYRGDLRPYRKDPDSIRLLFFGDSHTFSMGADDEHSYPAVTQNKLNSGSDKFECLNFGVLGQDMRQILMHIDNHAFKYDSDMIVFTFHSGDLLESPYDMVNTTQKEEELDLLYRIKRDALKHSYVARLTIPYLIGILRNEFTWNPGITSAEYREITENGPRWNRLKADLLELKIRLAQQNIALVFVLFPSMTSFDNHPAYPAHNALTAWLVNNDIPTLDLLPFFEGHDASTLTASLLDKHPNEKGYEIAGNAVAEFIEQVVETKIFMQENSTSSQK